MKTTKPSKAHRIIGEEIERSRESEGNKRLVQILDTVLQIPHIGKCVVAEAKNQSPSHQHTYTNRQCEIRNPKNGAQLTRLRMRTAETAAQREREMC